MVEPETNVNMRHKKISVTVTGAPSFVIAGLDVWPGDIPDGCSGT